MIWRIILAAVLIYIVVRRANLVAIYGKTRYSQRRYPEAMKIFKFADKIGNLNANNKMLLGYVCLRCGELDNARKHLRFCSTMTRPGSAERNQVNNLLALVCWKEGNLDDGIEILEDITEKGYKNTVIYQNLGIFYNLSDDKEKALKFNLEAYEYNSDDDIICDNLADSYARLGEYKKAEEIYKSLIEKDPEPRFPEVYYGYGETLIKLGSKDEGLKMIEKALAKPFSYLSIKAKEEIEEMYRGYGGDLDAVKE